MKQMTQLSMAKALVRWAFLVLVTVPTSLEVSQTKSSPVGYTKIIEDTEQQLAVMRKRWKRNIVGDFDAFPGLAEDPEIVAYAENLSNDAMELFITMDLSNNRSRLWPKVSTDTNSADMTTQFKKLTILAKAYGTKGTAYCKDDAILKEIVAGLDFMTAFGRYSGEKYSGNWWDWQIGTPQAFTTILMVIIEEIEQKEIDKYVNIIHKYLPDPYKQLQGQSQDQLVALHFLANFNNSGANRADQAISYLGMGLLLEDSKMIYTAVDSIKETFELVTQGDGFYEDGSFIQHYDIPYTGAYGNLLVKSVGDILSIVAQTQWQLDENSVTQFVTNVQNAFLPIVVKGETMSFVNGRSITRSPSDKKKGMGSATMYNLLIASELANTEQNKLLQQAAKYWMVQNIEYYYQNTRNFNDLLLTKNMLADTSLGATKPFLGSHVYGAMDRYVYSDPSVQLGISMYSTRISAFEAGNKENKKGWHLSDGMMYLYNDDLQFGPTYWPTVDWYRLPGTTVDTVSLEEEITSFKSFKSPAAYVGGVSDGDNAVISMQLNKEGWLNNGYATNMNLKAKKSWFVMDGKIISLGTDINGRTTSTIETFIENRLLDPTSNYSFTDHLGKDASTQKDRIVTMNDWFLLKSSKENQSIGYIMLDDQIIQTQLEERTGTYKEINDEFPSNTMYKETYQKLLISHGNQVVNAQYAYLTYPNATKDHLATFDKDQQYSILANTPDIQAVKDNTNKLFGATIWKETGGEIDGIHVNKPVTLLYQRAADQLIILSISNPKQNNDVIEITIPEGITEVITMDEGITVKDSHMLHVDTTGGLGKTFQLTAKMTRSSSDAMYNPVERTPSKSGPVCLSSCLDNYVSI